MLLETESYKGELAELRKLRAVVKHNILAERLGNTYFICGEGGEKNSSGLPKSIYICPAFGVDWFQVYRRTKTSIGPGW